MAFSVRHHENVEVTFGVHHRSGAEGTLGHMVEGYNADTLGLRARL